MPKGVWQIHLHETGIRILPCKEGRRGEMELRTVRAFEGFVDGPNGDDDGE